MNAVADDLDSDAIRHAMSAACARRIGAVDYVDAIDSTNAEMLRRGARQPDLAVLVAGSQHAGRGRRGRSWTSPPGANLYLSLHRRFGREPRVLGGLSLVVGIACAEALHALGQQEVRLKWPNDLQARGRKLGGVLIELLPGAAVIGVGINVGLTQDDADSIDQPWIDLATLGAVAPRAQLIGALLDQLIPALDCFDRDGLEPFRTRWNALDALAGRTVHLLAGADHVEGEALGIADDGGLRIRVGAGERVFHSADVSLRAT